MSEQPPDAIGTYRDYRGETWIKDLDMRVPTWPLAYVWSNPTKRWRKKRERINLERFTPFDTTQGQSS